MILGPVAVGTGSATCYALNVGKSSIEKIKVRILWERGYHSYDCPNVAPSA